MKWCVILYCDCYRWRQLMCRWRRMWNRENDTRPPTGLRPTMWSRPTPRDNAWRRMKLDRSRDTFATRRATERNGISTITIHDWPTASTTYASQYYHLRPRIELCADELVVGGGVGWSYDRRRRRRRRQTGWENTATSHSQDRRFFLDLQVSATSPVISAGCWRRKVNCEYACCAQVHSRNKLIVHCLIFGGSYKCNVECWGDADGRGSTDNLNIDN